MANDNQLPPDSQQPKESAPEARDNLNRKEPPRGKLHCYNWLADVPGGGADFDIVEVQFKNTRKGFYRNATSQPLQIGDLVAVEASPGHDIGEVTLVGRLVAIQMKKANIKPDAELKRVFRKAKHGDIEKYKEARSKENDTMIRARRIAESLNLNMKIGDVEYQGDGNKAIFYYIADERVDFRQLIKVLAETFHVRIEMKQIGARQEAGRIGGIGPCGRPLCCASWMTNFVSVGTSAARFQDISLNPQKLAGQCAKLKCCLNFEVDSYVEGIKRMPSKEVRLETADNTYYFFKQDVFRRLVTYSTEKSAPVNLITIDADRALEVIALNNKGEKPQTLKRDGESDETPKKEFNDILGQDITRFDKKKKKKKSKPKGADEESPVGQPGSERKDRDEKDGKSPRQERNDRQDRADRNDRQDKGDKPQRNGKPKKKKPQSNGQAGIQDGKPMHNGQQKGERQDRNASQNKKPGGAAQTPAQPKRTDSSQDNSKKSPAE